jgi:hypothetical protein
MIVSLNEVEMTCYRAALGVNLPHGLAEDAASIAAKLVTTVPAGLAIMLRALRSAEGNYVAPPVFARDGHIWRARYPFLPSLQAGPIAADLENAEPGVQVEICATDEPSIVDICRRHGTPNGVPGIPIEVEDALWRELLRLAARTYVPASRISRLTGAGAGADEKD